MFIFGEIGFAGVVLLGIWIYAIFDVISTPEGAARNLPKIMWLAIVVFLPDIGSIAWLLLGRPSSKSFHLEGSRSYGEGGANRRERLNQELSRSDELNARLEQWERDNAARVHDAERAAALDSRETEVARREIETKQRQLAEWEERLAAQQRSIERPADGAT